MEREQYIPPEFRERSLQEKCGMLAVCFSDAIPQAIQETIVTQALSTLGNRGNNGAGHLRQDKNSTEWTSLHIQEPVAGLTRELLAAGLSPAQIMLFHTRYSTTGGLGMDNTQPFLVTNGHYKLALQHNGNIPDRYIRQIRARLSNTTLRPDASDTRIMTEFIMQERSSYDSWKATLHACLPEFKGAYSLLMLTEDGTVFAAKDPHGIRPLIYGKRLVQIDSRELPMFVIASESPALDALGIEPSETTEINPGWLYIFSQDGELQIEQFAEPIEHHCALEGIYFKRPETRWRGDTIAHHRHELGKGVAKRLSNKGILTDIDVVVPVLHTGLDSAIGLATEIGKELIYAVKRVTKERSFIQASDTLRQEAVRNKHAVTNEARRGLVGKGVAIVDDSLIRGNSIKDVLRKIRGEVISMNGDGVTEGLDETIGGPKSIHVVLAAPPLLEICDLGISIAHKDELIVHRLLSELDPSLAARFNDFRNLPEKEQLTLQNELESILASHLGVDSVTFSTHAILEKSFGTDNICKACFGGHHPIHHQEKFATAHPTD